LQSWGAADVSAVYAQNVGLNDNALDLVERDFIGAPVIELRCAGGGVVGD